jgi:hypothetical protein
MKHLYFDQGGAFGRGRYCITDERLPEPAEDDYQDIAGYYIGYMKPHYINNYIELFKKVYGEDSCVLTVRIPVSYCRISTYEK